MNDKENILLDNPHLKENPFSTPEDYFESNFIRIREKLSCSEQANPFIVPEDYFESNTLRIRENVLGSSNAFEVPENYFEDNAVRLNRTVLQLSQEKKLNASSEGRNRKIIYLNIFKYAVAAASIVGALWGIYFYVQPSAKDTILQQPCQTIACLTKQDILSRDQLLDEEIIEGAVSDEALDEYFDSSSSSFNDTNSNSVNETF